MSATRKAFLAAASAVGAGLAVKGAAQAQSPSPAPTATPAASAYAREFAQRMRHFDARLTDAQLDDIAHQVDQLSDFRSALRPKGHGLSNGDAPSPQFRVDE